MHNTCLSLKRTSIVHQMPHTSRKKEPRYTKQRKVEGEDGWTHISSDSPSKARPRVSSYDDYHADMKAKGYEPYTLQWDHGGCSMFTVTPEPADAAMADENLWSQYRVVEEKWKRSESCKVLISVLRERILLAETAISTCVCFGTGTFSGYRDKWIARHDVALTQLIAFKTVVDTIGRWLNAIQYSLVLTDPRTGDRPATVGFCSGTSLQRFRPQVACFSSHHEGGPSNGFLSVDSRVIRILPGCRAERRVAHVDARPSNTDGFRPFIL